MKVLSQNYVLINYPNILELPYGDQGLFMWRKTYDLVGGYPDYRLMEDYEMVMILP